MQELCVCASAWSRSGIYGQNWGWRGFQELSWQLFKFRWLNTAIHWLCSLPKPLVFVRSNAPVTCSSAVYVFLVLRRTQSPPSVAFFHCLYSVVSGSLSPHSGPSQLSAGLPPLVSVRASLLLSPRNPAPASVTSARSPLGQVPEALVTQLFGFQPFVFIAPLLLKQHCGR